MALATLAISSRSQRARPPDDGSLHLARHGIDGLQSPREAAGKARLDDIDAEFG
jgi:hypothetical protein